MKTIYLRYNSRDAGQAALSSILGWEPDTTTGTLGVTRYDVDEVGILYKPIPENAVEGYMPEACEGWHINLLWWGEDGTAPDFAAEEIAPVTPSRVFAI